MQPILVDDDVHDELTRIKIENKEKFKKLGDVIRFLLEKIKQKGGIKNEKTINKRRKGF